MSSVIFLHRFTFLMVSRTHLARSYCITSPIDRLAATTAPPRLIFAPLNFGGVHKRLALAFQQRLLNIREFH